MAEITIDNTNPVVLDWTAKGKERIIQNIHNILNTYKYEVAYNRDFGISPDVIDTDIETMKGVIMDDLYENITKYEPRATLKSVDVQDVTVDGTVVAVVKIEL